MSQFLSTNDQSLEDTYVAEVLERLRLTAIAEVARRGTTFPLIRKSVEADYGRACDLHGIDGSDYRVRFLEQEDHPDVGLFTVAYDFRIDLSRPDTEWVVVNPVAADPAIARLLLCL